MDSFTLMETWSELHRAIKEMENELEPRVSGKVDSVRFKARGWEARQDVKVLRLVLNKRAGEQSHDLWEPISVPEWVRPVHRRRDQEGELGVVLAGLAHD